MNKTGTVLDKIVAARMRDNEDRKRRAPFATVRAAAESAPAPLDFRGALAKPGVSLIAEMKRSSPSGGELRLDLDPAQVARTYAESGASAISVLTEPDFFKGGIDDLVTAKRVAGPLGVPVLEKDFVFEPYQVYEARANGADAVLLIVAILDDALLKSLYGLATELQLAALVEVFDEGELDRSLRLDPKLVGVNNRNLKTLVTSLTNFEALAERIPSEKVRVAESGMKNAADVRRMAAAGADAVLVGEALMRAGSGLADLAREIASGGA